jgi:hypothetical protein
MSTIDIWGKKTEYDVKFSTAKVRWKKALDLYNRNFTILPEELVESDLHEVIPLTGRTIANVIAGAITPRPKDITVHVEPVDEKQPSKDQADLMEEWGREVLMEAGKDLIIDPMFQHALNFELYGVTHERVVPFHDKLWGPPPVRAEGESEQQYIDRLHEYEVKKRSNFPIDCMPLDPQIGYHNARYRQPTEYLEYGWRMVDEIRETYKSLYILPGLRGGDRVLYLAYTGPTRRIREVRGATVQNQVSQHTLLDVPNILGMPYIVALSGETKIDPAGLIENEQVGNMWHMGDILKEEAMIITILSIIFQKTPFPTMKARDPDRVEIDHSRLGSVWKDPDDSLKPVDTGRLSPETMELLTQAQMQLERHTGAKLLMGSHIGARSGAHEEMYLQQGLERYGPMIHAMERIVAMRLEKIAYFSDQIIMGPVVRRTRKKDLFRGGYYKFEVQFKAKDLLKNVRLINMGLALVNANRISERFFLEEILQVENASKMQREIGADRVIASAPFLQLMARESAKDAGLEDSMREAEEEARMLQQAQPAPQLKAGPNMGIPPMASEAEGLKEMFGPESGVDMEQLAKELATLGGA